jgi:GntR family transcriptional regulator, transcriptional repressor for pyruvate dehydrogenase complex
MSYQPVERRKVYELIADQLVAEIAGRRLKPGDVLPPERELTQLYGAGRSSVREALRMLESRGLIESEGNGSFAVADYRNPLNTSLRLLLSLDEANMREIYELRRILECEAAALAAVRRTDGHLVQMDRAIDDMEQGLDSPDADAELYIDADLRFHVAVAEATGNRLVLHSMQALRDLLRRALMTIFLIPQSPERSLEQHRAIRAAIVAGDPDRAREEMRAHLVRVESDVHQIVAEGLKPVGTAGGGVSG